MKEYLAGFDIGGTKLTLAIADQSGLITAWLKEETDITSDHFTDYRDGLAYLGLGEQMKRMLQEALREAGGDKPAVIGIGAAGPLKDGDIRNPTNIKLINLPRGCKGDATLEEMKEALVSCQHSSVG